MDANVSPILLKEKHRKQVSVCGDGEFTAELQLSYIFCIAGNARKTRTDKGVPRKKAAVFLSGVDGFPEEGLDEKLYIRDQVVELSC